WFPFLPLARRVGQTRRAYASTLASRRDSLSFLGRQRHADDLLVIANINRPIRERRMRPENVSIGEAAAQLARRLDDVCPADLLISFRTQLRDDQVALLVEQPVVIALFDQECIGPALLRLLRVTGRFQRHP